MCQDRHESFENSASRTRPRMRFSIHPDLQRRCGGRVIRGRNISMKISPQRPHQSGPALPRQHQTSPRALLSRPGAPHDRPTPYPIFDGLGPLARARNEGCRATVPASYLRRNEPKVRGRQHYPHLRIMDRVWIARLVIRGHQASRDGKIAIAVRHTKGQVR